MKKLLLILLIALSFNSKSQTNAQMYIWRVLPTTVCPGDSIKIDFKYTNPVPITYTVNNNHIYINPQLTEIWTGNSVTYPNLPSEAWTGSSGSCYYIKAQVPYTITPGTHSIIAGATNYSNTIQVLNCATGIEEQTQDQKEIIYFDLYGNKIEPRKNELIIQQSGTRRKKVFIQ